MVEFFGDPNEDSQDEDGHVSKKQKHAKGQGQKPVTCSRLTERKLACARLVSAHKYECKKILDQICHRQAKWRSKLAVSENPKPNDNVVDQKLLIAEQAFDDTIPERTHCAWKQAEREALKKCFLSFGFGRWQEIENSMKSNLKIVKHGRGDMQDACWQFASELLNHVTGKEEAYLRQQLNSVEHKGSIKTPGVPWTKVEGSAKIWVRRLQLLDNITAIANEIENPETNDIFESALMSMSGTNSPAQWWTAKTDLTLIRGIHKHGYGNYEAVRTDSDFSWAFSDVNQKADAAQDHVKNGVVQHPPPPPQWPATDILTKRLKRVTDHLVKTGQLGGNRTTVPSLWSRKESMEMLKVLMMYGMPQGNTNQAESPQKNCVDWEFLARESKLTNHPVSAVKALCEDLAREAWEGVKDSGESSLAQCDRSLSATNIKKRERDIDAENVLDDLSVSAGKNDDEYSQRDETSSDACLATSDDQINQETVHKRDKVLNKPLLTPVSASRLRERLSMFETLQQGLPLIKDRALKGNLSNRTVDLPEWWVAGIHDYELGEGVLKHGMGSWTSIETDGSLSFMACSHLFKHTGEKLPMLCESNPVDEANRLLEAKNVPKCEASQNLDVYRSLPDGSILLKRLKHIISQLRRVFKLMPLLACFPKETGTASKIESPLSKASGDGQPGGTQLVRPKKCKYSKNIMVKRDEFGNPVLPLMLTYMLTLLDLGTIEWERISFHSERHIYPVGFSTKRRFSSTVDPSGSTIYTCTIVDGGSRPVFTITAEDNEDLVIQNDTPSGSWVELFCLVNKVRGIKKDKVTISGTDMFGLSHPVVSQLIQELPNANRCMYFLPELSFCPPSKGLKRSDPKPVIGSATQAALSHTSTTGEMDLAPASQWNSKVPKVHNHFAGLNAGILDSWDAAAQVPVESIHSLMTPIYGGSDVPMRISSRHYKRHTGVPDLCNGDEGLVIPKPTVGQSKSSTVAHDAPTLVQMITAGSRTGMDAHRQNQVHVGSSMCTTDRQVCLAEVLPHLRQETGSAQQPRRQSQPFGVPLKVYTQHPPTSVGFAPEDHVVHSLSDTGRSRMLVAGPTCHEYQKTQYALPNIRPGPHRFHVMATDNMGLGPGSYQVMNPPGGEMSLPLHGGLRTQWPGQLLPGRQVAFCIPKLSEHQAPGNPRERQADDHLPDA